MNSNLVQRTEARVEWHLVGPNVQPFGSGPGRKEPMGSSLRNIVILVTNDRGAPG